MQYSKWYLSFTMTVHLHRGRWWLIVCHPYETLLNWQKGLHHQISKQPAAGIKLYSAIYQVTHGTLDTISQGFTWYLHQSRGINIVSVCLILRVRQRDPNPELVPLSLLDYICFSYTQCQTCWAQISWCRDKSMYAYVWLSLIWLKYHTEMIIPYTRRRRTEHHDHPRHHVSGNPFLPCLQEEGRI